MVLQTWSEVLARTFQDLWMQVAVFTPKLVVSLLFFLVGWIVGSVVGGVVTHLVRSLRVDKALRNLGAEELAERGGFNLDAGQFLGTLVRWFIVVVFLIVSLNVLGLNDVNQFLQEVVLVYLPKVIVAALILILGALVGDLAQRLILSSAKAVGSATAHMAGAISKWAILVFAFLAAFVQLGIAAELIQTLFSGLVAMLALAGGLAFGLGGKEAAARYLEKMRDEMSGR